MSGWGYQWHPAQARARCPGPAHTTGLGKMAVNDGVCGRGMAGVARGVVGVPGMAGWGVGTRPHHRVAEPPPRVCFREILLNMKEYI